MSYVSTPSGVPQVSSSPYPVSLTTVDSRGLEDSNAGASGMDYDKHYSNNKTNIHGDAISMATEMSSEGQKEVDLSHQ